MYIWGSADLALYPWRPSASFKLPNFALGPYSAMGGGSNVAKNIVVGSNCIVGPNSFLTRDLEDGSTVLGVPARKFS